MDSITSIEQLVREFDDADPIEQGGILKRIEIPKSEFEEAASWREGDYTRNCIARTDDFEFILLCWDKHCKTKIHDHSGQNCWVYQVDGSVREVRYEGVGDGLNVYSEEILDKGGLSFMQDDMGYHMIENFNNSRAMTLHVYVKPIDSCLVYDDDAFRFKTVEMEYDTVGELVEAS